MMQRTAAILAGLLVVTGLSGCVGVQTTVDRDAVLAAIAATEAGARTIDWTQSTSAGTVSASVTVVDDLRWSVTATQGGRVVASEVVDDQARALQLPGSGQIRSFEAASAGATPSPASVRALATGAWVLDPAGASTLHLASVSTGQTDVLVTALGVLEHVRAAIADADNTKPVVRHNIESPDYAPLDDFFPQPSSGEVRYDLVPPPLPPRQQAGQGAAAATNQSFSTAMFRSMAVYVRDGLVVAVAERVGITHAELEDASVRLADRGIRVPADWAHRDQLEAGILALGRGSFASPISWGSMSATVALSSTHDVSLPANATSGSLDGIGSNQQVLYQS